MAYTVDEFAQKIKTKYPEYADMDNTELSKKIVNKHPEYSSQVSFEPTQTPESDKPTQTQESEQINNTMAPQILAGGVEKKYTQNWDKNGRAYLTDENGEKVNNNGLSWLEKQGRKIKAGVENAKSWVEETNPDSEAYKQKVNAILALETAPMGGGAISAKLAPKLIPFLGKTVGTATSEGIGAGLLSGAVNGAGRGVIEHKNPVVTSLQDAVGGAVGGGLLGLGGSKLVQKFAGNNLKNYGNFEELPKIERKALRKNAKKYYQNYIQGTKVNHEDIGNITFSGVGADETISKNPNYSKNFPTMKNDIKNSDYIGSEDLYKERKDKINQFHKLEDGDNQHIIAADDNGNKYYLTKNEDGTNSLLPNSGRAEVPSNNIIANSSQKFNPPAGNRSQFAQTVKGSNLATEDLKSNINDVGYKAITNKETLANAQAEIEDLGQAAAIAKVLKADVNDAHQVAMAMSLANDLQQSGIQEQVDVGSKIIEDLSRKASRNGQASQALAMWNFMTPQGALRSYTNALEETVPNHVKPFIDSAKKITKQLQNASTQDEAERIIRANLRSLPINAKTKIINQIKQARETGTINEDVLVKAIKDHFNVKSVSTTDIDEINSLTSQIAQATTEREKEVATALLQRKIAEVKPTTLGRKLSTTQAMAQLLNPKTVIRNIAGNSMYGGLENTTQSLLASPIDNLVSKFTGERSVLPNDLKIQYQGMIDGAKQGAEDVRLGIDTAQNKYDLPSGRTFRSGIGEKAEKLMNYTLRVPDRAAYQAVYEEALQNQMGARGLSKPTDDIINQAKEEALKRTFQDDSALAKLFQGTKKGLNFNKEFGLGDFVLKYAKTPANILSRGLSYSPVGLAKGVGELTLPSINKSMPFNQRKAVMDIARGLMGTGIMGGGYALAKNGQVTGQKDDNPRMNANLMAMGERPYSIKVGDKNYSYDWAVPASMPFSAGVNYNNGADFLGSVASSMDTLTEQPLLQGVKKLTGGGFKTIPEGLVDTVVEAPNSFYPSALRQTAQTIDPYYRETRDNNVAKQAINRTISNTPFASEMLPKKYEVTGRPIKREGGIAQNFLNPANVSSVKNNKGLSEAIRLEKPYLSVGKKLKVGEGMKQLTPKEMADYQRLVGQANDKFINDFVNSNEYQTLSDDERADKIEKIQKDVNKGVKNKLFDTEPLLGKKQRTREQIIKSKLAKYNRVQNLIRKSNINEFINQK